LPMPPAGEAEAPEESAKPAPPATSPSFKNSLRVMAMQLPPCFRFNKSAFTGS
jgi:hypothetical protein